MTIKEIATRCGVSPQAIRAWCKRNEVAKDAQGNWVIDASVLASIYEHYRVDQGKDGASGAQDGCACSASELASTLRSEVEHLRRQIEVKDRQIADLSAALLAEQQAVKAAQVLQAMDKPALESAEQKQRRRWWQFWR